MHEIYSYFKKIVDSGKNVKNLHLNFTKMLIVMLPVVPHIASECLEKFSNNKNFLWPEVNKKFLLKDDVSIVIQINGKKRGIINTYKNIDEEKLILLIKKDQLLNKYLFNKKLIKKIYIKNKLINLLIK